MEQHIALQRAHEKERGSARIADAQSPRRGGAAEVVGDDGEAAARRTVALRIEGKDQRRLLRVGVHGGDDVRGDDVRGEGDELLRDAAENGAGIGLAGCGGEVADAGGRLEDVPAAHGLGEEGIFGLDVAQHCGGCDAELPGDVGQRSGGESFGREDAAGGLHDLVPLDARRAAHL
jgi:hypothetical protein